MKTIHELAETLLMNKKGLPYDKILAALQKRFPKSAVNPKHLSWYASRLKARKQKLPTRPRTRWAA